jgi:hypothetical protein
LKRYFAFSEYCPCLDSKILLAPCTTETLAVLEAVNKHIATMRAVFSVLETDLLEVFLAGLLVFEIEEEIGYAFEVLYHNPSI